jgi:transcription elongation factor Elf1
MRYRKMMATINTTASTEGIERERECHKRNSIDPQNRCLMSETEEEEIFTCDRCGISFNSESQMNSHKVSDHAVASGELTTR